MPQRAQQRAERSTWSRFRALSAADRRLVVEAAAVLVFVRLGVALLPFSALRVLLDRYARAGSPIPPDAAAPGVSRFTWAVAAAASRFPVRMSCLVQALAADAMLRRRGVSCRLRIGVHPRSTGSGALKAHAWIEHEGAVVLGALEDLREYAVLSSPGSS